VESIVIPLSKEFIEWLVSGKFTSDAAQCSVEEFPDCDSVFSADDVQSGGNEILFPELRESIQRAIDDLGGSVIPKLNWSSPKDAVWMNWTGNLKCTDSEQVILLLKSSDCIMHDLTEPFSFCEDESEHENLQNNEIQYYIVLRKWETIEPASEFRCFVSNDKIIGISQRNHSQYFDFLKNLTKSIQNTVIDFFEVNMKGKFASNTYVFDVYLKNLTKTPSAVLLDINPFGRVTDSLLFSWEELFLLHIAMCNEEASHKIETDFRYIAEPIHIQPTLSTSNAKPIDDVDVTTMQGMLELMRLQKAQQHS